VTPARLRPLAEADLIGRTRYYRSQGGDELGERFFHAAIISLRAIERMPGTGSLHIGEICAVPCLRVRRIAGFPRTWFYIVGTDHVDVVRLLAWLAAKLGPDLLDAVVVTTGSDAYRRPDGIAVVPAALLGP
jgi:plasmid stabilization system protein ParE